MGIGSTFKKGVRSVGHAVKRGLDSQLVHRAGAVVAPITLLPALANSEYRKDTGPIYATYGAIGVGAVGAAAAGLTGAAIIGAGSAPVAGLATSLIGSGLSGGSKTTNITNRGGGSGGGGGGDGSSYGAGLGSASAEVPVWVYYGAAALAILAAIIVALRRKKKKHV